MHGDADRLDTAGRNGASANREQSAIRKDAKDGDLVAAGIRRQQVASVTAQLERSL
jgi:hypothetical protein